MQHPPPPPSPLPSIDCTATALIIGIIYIHISLSYYIGHKGIGHKGRHGHEFLDYEISSDGKLRYANDSLYKLDGAIRKEMYLNDNCLTELRRIIESSGIMREDDNLWPEPDEVGRQELEVVMGDQHISFCTAKVPFTPLLNSITPLELHLILLSLLQIGTIAEVESCKDANGLAPPPQPHPPPP